MSWRRKRARVALMAAVAILAAGIGVVAHEKELLRWLELQSIDARFSVRGTQPEPKGVAVVAIDARTFNERPLDRWPFGRRLHGRAITILQEAGAKVIAFTTTVQAAVLRQSGADWVLQSCADIALASPAGRTRRPSLHHLPSNGKKLTLSLHLPG